MKHALQPRTKSAIFSHVVAKSITERQNSNYLHMANTSTPFYYRAFFVRSTRTPKERLERLSMVACNGKGSPFAVFHMSQFLTPLHVTAQSVRTLAVALQVLHMELSAMIYKFLLLDKNCLTIRIRANSEAEARQRIKFTSPALCIARFNDKPTAKSRGFYG
ncbi:ash family protein [Glaesserella parasuis]|uniref:ash family protein n=1 Tax=Glaesserella parasuis TaxID=738 RepID=UPI002436A30D|nr:ash family protein [Glaesserella parasuis]MDG6831993.1 ash family protein [Glaesserella parasuis]